MSFYEKNRWSVVSKWQHLYQHSLADFSYTNPSLPGVTNVESAMNWILSVIYPNAKPAVATPAALPLVGNSIGDYRVVTDDGDGKSAGYRWEQREGELAASWHKILDVDWSTESILESFFDVAQDLYVLKGGRTDIDGAGNPVSGLYAGQTIYGGNLANQNLTLHANSGDGTGPATGFVQVDGNFRPTLNNTWDLSTNTERWKNAYFSGFILVNTLNLAAGSITDSSGAISFGDENLSTTGNIAGAELNATTHLRVTVAAQSTTIVPGTYTDTTGAVSFVAANLSTTGTLGAGVTTLTSGAQTIVLNPDNAGNASFIISHATLSFGAANLLTTGNITGAILTGSSLVIDNLLLDGNTISTTDLNGNLNLVPDGTGQIVLGKATSTSFIISSTANISTTAAGIFGNLRLQGNTLSSENTNGDIVIDPNGTGIISFASGFNPTTDNSFDFGTSALRIKDIYLAGGLSNGTHTASMASILSVRHILFRDIAQTLPAQNGDALFYDATNNVWLASVPDTEVDHSQVSGLTVGDAGHTQFAMLAGRAGGQSIIGGTASGENLTLESTSNATKGLVQTKDNFAPFTNASFSGSWSGLDLGTSSLNFRDVYTKGEFKGFRLENVGTLPASSGQNIGRLVYNTTNGKSYYDTGAVFKILGLAKYNQDTVWNGSDTTKTVTVSSDIEDARNAIWQIKDNANNFEVLGWLLEALSATQVRITTSIPPAAGAYRLTGIE